MEWCRVWRCLVPLRPSDHRPHPPVRMVLPAPVSRLLRHAVELSRSVSVSVPSGPAGPPRPAVGSTLAHAPGTVQAAGHTVRRAVEHRATSGHRCRWRGGCGWRQRTPRGGQAHACRASALGAAWWAEEADGPLSGGEGRCWGTWGGGAGDCLPHVNKRLHTPFCPLQGHVYTTMPIPPGGMQVCPIAQDCHPCQGVLHVPCIRLESVRICRMTGHPMTRAC